jgi:adenylosuccinate lyase
MNFSSLTALSPSTAATRPSSHRRVQVEVEWFIAPSDAGFAEFKPLSEAARGLLRGLVVRFSEADAQAIKDIEKTTNHDVKAVEY